jgi:hypothetical protein
MDSSFRALHQWRTAGAAIIATAIALNAFAGPASAAGGTKRFVDDDGLAAANGCNGNLPVPKRIQLAINHSHKGDIIVVCPGDYFGRVEIDDRTDLTVRAAEPWTANVIAPPDYDRSALVDVANSRHITIQWLNLLAQTEQCVEPIEGMISLDDVFRASIRSNHIGVLGTDTLGDCGYETGILVDQGGGPNIAYNRITDFKDTGIRVNESPAVHNVTEWRAASIRGNTVRYYHATYGPGAAGDAVGIALGETEGVDVEGNWVSSLPDAGVSTPRLGLGMFVRFSFVFPMRVVDNHILHTDSGLALEGLPPGTVVRDNQIRDTGSVGIDLFGGTGAMLENNTVVDGSGDGITVGNEFFDPDSSVGNTIKNNDFRGHGGTDCVDYDDPTDSTWMNNQGDTQNQAGLCSSAP